MKILHIISSLETGGAQKLLSELLPALGVCGVTSDILVFFRVHNHIEKELEDAGIRIISLDINNLRSPALIPALRKHIRKYDLAHVHLFPALYEVPIAVTGLNVPLVYTEHSTSNRRREKPFFRPVEKFIYGKYARIIAISKKVEESLKDWVGDEIGKRIITIENGINLRKIEDAQPYPDWKDSKILLMVSRFNDSKDQKTVIQSIPLLNDQRLKVAFAGEGPNLNECRQLASKLNVSDRVLFLGNRSDVPRLATACFLGIQASNWEGFGLTAVEIMAACKPVIASDVSGLNQVVGNAGILFRKGNHQELARCVNSLDSNENLYQITAENCCKRAQSFSIQKTAQRYALLYSELLNKTLNSK